MPTRAKHPCSRCRKHLTTERVCTACDSTPTPDRHTHGNSHQRGYTKRWRRYSHRFLAEHPLCHYCALQGRITASACVDHATPAPPDSPLFWDETNHRAACIPCNSSKGQRTETDYLHSLGLNPQQRKHFDC